MRRKQFNSTVLLFVLILGLNAQLTIDLIKGDSQKSNLLTRVDQLKAYGKSLGDVLITQKDGI